MSCLQGINFEYVLGQEESTIPTCIRYWGDHRRVCRPDPGTALSKAGATCLSNDGEFIQRVIHAWKGDTDSGGFFARKLQRRCEK